MGLYLAGFGDSPRMQVDPSGHLNDETEYKSPALKIEYFLYSNQEEGLL
jgi:hypothetical protein